MTLQIDAPVCDHDYRGVCFLCSDLRPWWREARIEAGYGAEPLYVWRWKQVYRRTERIPEPVEYVTISR